MTSDQPMFPIKFVHDLMVPYVFSYYSRSPHPQVFPYYQGKKLESYQYACDSSHSPNWYRHLFTYSVPIGAEVVYDWDRSMLVDKELYSGVIHPMLNYDDPEPDVSPFIQSTKMTQNRSYWVQKKDWRKLKL